MARFNTLKVPYRPSEKEMRLGLHFISFVFCFRSFCNLFVMSWMRSEKKYSLVIYFSRKFSNDVAHTIRF